MLNCAIGIVLYNRPAYTKTLFDALSANHYADLFPVYISIDDSDRTDELLELAKAAKSIGIVDIQVNKPKAGCGFNHVKLIGRIREDDFILLEDDTIPLAPDALNYFFSQFPKLKGENLFSVCGYMRSGEKDQPYGIHVRNHFCPWGFAMTKEKWYEVKAKVFDGPWEQSWDTAIQNSFTEKPTIYPALGRIQNVGAEMGTYVPSSAWHHANQHVPLGAWDVEVEKRELGKWQRE